VLTPANIPLWVIQEAVQQVRKEDPKFHKAYMELTQGKKNHQATFSVANLNSAPH
jgi:hypothetical protein